MRKSTWAVLPFALGLLTAACQSAQAPPAPAEQKAAVDASLLRLFAPLPRVIEAKAAVNEDEIVLGRMLYYEPRLSKSQKISCNSCHDLARYGVDGKPTSDGHKGQKGDRNAPTVFNAAGHFAQFWDGRAPDVEEQAKGPVLNPVEMAMPGQQRVVAVLESMPEYVDAFKKAFPADSKPISYDNMARAIGAFERRLMTPSRWDALLAGDQKALTEEEMLGLRTFLDTGCQSCHNGALVGGNTYQRLGAVKPYSRSPDPGRFKLTKNEADRKVFKVPSLRNVAETAPYYHDGGVASLEEAVRQMAEFQLGRNLTAEQTRQIVDFLKVLTGKIDAEHIKAPVLPKSTPKTPKPDLS